MGNPIKFGTRPTDHAGYCPVKVGDECKGLGRLAARDPRDGLFRFRDPFIRKQLGAGKPRTFRNWSIDPKRLPLDQGPTPRCCGFGTTTALIVGPNTQRHDIPDIEAATRIANELYVASVQQYDEWEDDSLDFGTSVRGVMKAAMAAGFIKSFAWGDGVEDTAEYVLNYGPAVIGVVWPDSMMRTDDNGYLNIDPGSTMDGPHAQGHCVCLAHVNMTKKNPDGSKGFFEIPQTWGKGWGWKGTGRAKISSRTLGIQVAAGAELCFPVENKVLTPAPVAVAA